MKIISTRSAVLPIERTWDKTRNKAHFLVTESVTNYYVTIKVIGYEMPAVLDWKVSKKAAANMLQACKIIETEALKFGNI